MSMFLVRILFPHIKISKNFVRNVNSHVMIQ